MWFFYFNSSQYQGIQISVSRPFNIWRCPSPNYLESNHQSGSLSIYRLVNSSYINETSKYYQIRTVLAANNWEKTIYNLPAGTYRFCRTSYGEIIEGEWYLESLYTGFLLQDGNNLCISNGANLDNKTSLPYTIDKFDTYSMNDLSAISKDTISLINNQKYNIALLK